MNTEPLTISHSKIAEQWDWGKNGRMTVMVLARPKLLPHPGKGIGGCVRVTLRIEITTGSSVPDDHGTAGREKNGPAVEKR